jgi:hypothetical protein
MTERDLAAALISANGIERAARAQMHVSAGDERDAAQGVMRHAVALRKSIETWIAARSIRAMQQT